MLQVGAVDRIGVVVLAGGRSSRFGSDKTRAELSGSAVLDHVLGAVAAARTLVPLDDAVVVGPWAPPGVRHEVEPVRFLGPAAAVAHGLAVVGAGRSLVVAGDHPALVPDLLALLVARMGSTSTADAVVPIGPSGPEPLVACYRAEVATVAARRVDDGHRSMRGLLDELRVEWVEPPEWSVVDPDGVSFLDVDAPEDLARFEP